MIEAPLKGSWIIFLSFIIAMMLMVIPMPDWSISWRPAWLALVLIYWCMAMPERIGIGVGWLVGMLLDVQQGTVLGLNAMGFTMLAYITLKSYQRMRIAPLPRQAIMICCYLLVYEFIVLMIRIIIGVPPQSWTYWMPALTSMLIWPWVFIILRDTRRKYIIADSA